MKILFKKLLYPALGAAICVFLSLPAGAQHTGSTGSSGGGGGSHSSGGSSSGGGARSSGGGSSGGSRPSGGSSFNRSSGSPGMARSNGSGQRSSAGYVTRQSGAARGNYGYPQRPAAQRTVVGYAPRPATVSGGVRPGTYATGGGVVGYRTAPRVGYQGYWGTHGYYHYNHGYYRTYYYPKIGFTCAVLPYGYYPFFWGDSQYFYSDGLFYNYDNSSYTVVEPPVGAEVTTLPDKAQSIVINGVQYYELDGVYYQPVTKDDGSVVYEVVGKDGELNTGDGTAVQDQQPQGPQMGDIVTQLPDGCKKIKVSGQTLWVSPDGVYYQELVDANGNKTYKIVGLPSDENGQN